MKSFVIAAILLAAIALGSSLVLNGQFQKNADQAFSTTGARIERSN